MGRGTVTPDETIELIKATFSATGSYDAAAKAAGVGWGTARKYADSRDEFEVIREQKRAEMIPSIIEMCGQAQIAFLTAMMDPAKLKAADLNQIAVSFGIVTEKGLLMAGQATARTETITDPSQRLTPEQMEQASIIRSKLAAEASR